MTTPTSVFEEVLWASTVPFVAAARVGKVHYVDPERPSRTLCGRKIGPPRKRFSVHPDDPRCSLCARKA